MRTNRRVLRLLAALVSIAALVGCVERLHATIGHWGPFVFWAVAGIVALAWPVAFLVAAAGATQQQRRAVFATAFALTGASIGLLLVGWGLVMVLNPEYTVGWYIPARGGGSGVDSVADAAGSGRAMIAGGALLCLAVVGFGRMMGRAADGEDPEPDEEELNVGEQVSGAALVLWACGGLFWLIALGIGLVAMIQYDGVREKLAGCDPGVASCARDVWVANELPWILVVAGVVALLLVAAALGRGPLSRIASVCVDSPALLLATGWLYQIGSVLALASGALFVRWSDATCTGDRSSRRCGATSPWFSFAEEWLPWVAVWTLVVYAALAYLIVFPLLAGVEWESAARPADERGSGRHVVAYLVSLALVAGVAWSAVAWWQRDSAGETSGPWDEYAAEHMSPSAYPHLEGAEVDLPTGRDPSIPIVVQISLDGDEPEMPAAETAALVDAACSYRPSRWRAGASQTWVRVSYGAGEDRTRFAEIDCETSHPQATADLLAWMEERPADGVAAEVSTKSRDDGVLETILYLPDTSATSFRTALTYLCALPETGDVQRSGTIYDAAATEGISGIDCSDPDAAVAEWRSLV